VRCIGETVVKELLQTDFRRCFLALKVHMEQYVPSGEIDLKGIMLIRHFLKLISLVISHALYFLSSVNCTVM
jgi:hypothetical protein